MGINSELMQAFEETCSCDSWSLWTTLARSNVHSDMYVATAFYATALEEIMGTYGYHAPYVHDLANNTLNRTIRNTQ